MLPPINDSNAVLINNKTPYDSLKSQLVKLNFHYSPALQLYTLKEWIVLELFDLLHGTTQLSIPKLITALAQNDFNPIQIKEHFTIAIAECPNKDHKIKLVQLDLLMRLQGQHLSRTLKEIFQENPNSDPHLVNDDIGARITHGIEGIYSLFSHYLNRAKSLQKERIDFFLLFPQLDEIQRLKKDLPSLTRKLQNPKDVRDLTALKKAYEKFTDQLLIVKTQINTASQLSPLMAIARLQTCYILVKNAYQFIDAEKNEYEKGATKSKSPEVSKTENLIAQLNSLQFRKKFKLSKADNAAAAKFFAEYTQELVAPCKTDVDWAKAYAKIYALIKGLSELPKGTNFDAIKSTYEEYKKAMEIFRLSAQNSYINDLFEVKKAVGEKDQFNDIELEADHLRQNFIILQELCSASNSFLNGLFSKKLTLANETAEDELAVFSMWENKTSTKEKTDNAIETEVIEDSIEPEETDSAVETAGALEISLADQLLNATDAESLIRMTIELITAKISKRTIVAKEQFGHLYLASYGMDMFISACKNQQWYKLGSIYPMLLVDWHTILESKLPRNKKENSHSLVLKSLGCSLTEQEKNLFFSLDNGLIWSRYPASSEYRQPKLQSDGQIWLMFSLDLLKNNASNPQKLERFIDFVIKTHFQVLAYTAKSIPSIQQKFGRDLFLKVENKIINDLKTSSPIPSKRIAHETIDSIIFKIEKILSHRLETNEKTGIIHSYLGDVRSHLLRLSATLNNATDSVWTKRNLMNIQWVLETLYICRTYLRTGAVMHFHDFTIFQSILNEKQNDVLSFNYGPAIHYPYQYAAQNTAAAQFCADLEAESTAWDESHNKLISPETLNIQKAIELISAQLDALIREGNWDLRNYVIVK